ncbi:MAG TPA: hypothetical protein PKM75_00645 [Prolixibacteraceae bacterium]|nr:hypothetical protein [Prolixibacteraceae bacterium]
MSKIFVKLPWPFQLPWCFKWWDVSSPDVVQASPAELYSLPVQTGEVGNTHVAITY